MIASDHIFPQTTQKSLFIRGSQLFKVSALATVSLLNAQVVLAQTEGSAVELAIPQPAETAEPYTAQPQPPVVTAPTVLPQVTAPAVPSSITPDSAESETAAETVDYGAIFIEPVKPDQATAPSLDSLLNSSQANEAPAAGNIPAVELISPADYSAGLIDQTDYSVGATMPEVFISERSSGCEFAVETGTSLPNTACNQVSRLTTAISNGIAPGNSQANTRSPIAIPGIQLPGSTTTASRDYYNQAAQAVVNLQLGEKFIFPLSMPASLTSLFGWRMHPIFGVRRFHTGTDLGAPTGTPVVATQSGRVSLSDFLGGYGLTVILRHNNDTLESRYAHLSQLLVQTGEWIEQGEVIGLVGSTGNSTGPHLHFELRQLTSTGWVVLNPDSLLQRTLGTLVQALGNSLVALSDNSTVKTSSDNEAISLQELPFRPAQPHAN